MRSKGKWKEYVQKERKLWRRIVLILSLFKDEAGGRGDWEKILNNRMNEQFLSVCSTHSKIIFRHYDFHNVLLTHTTWNSWGIKIADKICFDSIAVPPFNQHPSSLLPYFCGSLHQLLCRRIIKKSINRHWFARRGAHVGASRLPNPVLVYVFAKVA